MRVVNFYKVCNVSGEEIFICKLNTANSVSQKMVELKKQKWYHPKSTNDKIAPNKTYHIKTDVFKE